MSGRFETVASRKRRFGKRAGWIISLSIALTAHSFRAEAATDCATLKGAGAQITEGHATHFQPGAFPLVDRANVALFDTQGKQIFGVLKITRAGNDYEAYWQAQPSGKLYLLVLNGTTQGALMSSGTHWTLPFPPGTVVGPLAITSCADLGSR